MSHNSKARSPEDTIRVLGSGPSALSSLSLSSPHSVHATQQRLISRRHCQSVGFWASALSSLSLSSPNSWHTYLPKAHSPEDTVRVLGSGPSALSSLSRSSPLLLHTDSTCHSPLLSSPLFLHASSPKAHSPEGTVRVLGSGPPLSALYHFSLLSLCIHTHQRLIRPKTLSECWDLGLRSQLSVTLLP